ncbi:MAG: DUF2927 domain-containing protein [Saprospiraceae bacterium]|nr:DUF2927 domain-containing protein [Saprospiraceae bacterium]
MKPYRLLVFVLTSLIFFSCTKEEKELSQQDLETIAYFKDIALGFEFGATEKITRKWMGPMKVFVAGNPGTVMTTELDKIIAEIESLVTDGFDIQLVTDSLQANYTLFIGPAKGYELRYPFVSSYTPGNWGLFFVNWTSQNYINSGHMYVDNARADATAQKHLLREEFTQSLGLARDADTYPESIFQASWTTTTTYADIDRRLISLLYHPKVVPGMTETEVDLILREILLEN